MEARTKAEGNLGGGLASQSCHIPRVTWSQRASIVRVHFPLAELPPLLAPPHCQMPGRRRSLAGPCGPPVYSELDGQR